MRFSSSIDNVVLDAFSRFARRFLVKACVRIGVTPNQITFANLLVCAAAYLGLMSGAAYWNRLGALGVLFVYGLIDCLDGEVARAMGKGSPLGAWLDNRCDFAMQVVVLTGVSVTVVRGSPGGLSVGLGLAALASQALLVHYTDMFGGVFLRRPAFWRDLDASHITLAARLAAHVVSVDRTVALFLMTFRYPLVATTIVNRPAWFLGYVAAVQFVRTAVLHTVMYGAAKGARDPLSVVVRRYAIEQGAGPWPAYDPEHIAGTANEHEVGA